MSEYNEGAYDALDKTHIRLLEEKLQFYVDIFAYQGFDAKVVFEEMKRRAKQNKIPMNLFKDGVTGILVFFCNRGAKFSKPKVEGRTKEDGKSVMKKWYQIFDIKDEQPKTTTAITLPRMSSVFPWICGQIYNANKGRKVTMSEWYKPLQFPAAASLIPKGVMWNSFYQFWILWAIEFDKVVNPGNAKPDNVIKYAQFARDSDYLTDKQREEYLSGWGLSYDTLPTVQYADPANPVNLKTSSDNNNKKF